MLLEIGDEGGEVVPGLLVIDQSAKSTLSSFSLDQEIVGVLDHQIAVVDHLAELGDRLLEVVATGIG